MGTVSKPYTFTNGVGNLIDAPQVNADFDTLYTLVNGNLQAVNLKAGDGLFDSYRDIAQASAYTSNNPATQTGDNWLATSGNPVIEAVEQGIVAGVQGMVRYAGADYAVVGKTMKMRLQTILLVNSTAPGITLTPALFPISSVTSSAGGLRINPTLGAAVAGSGFAFASPAASSVNAGATSDFTPPADGNYLLGVTFSGAPAANSLVSWTTRLQIRAV